MDNTMQNQKMDDFFDQLNPIKRVSLPKERKNIAIFFASINFKYFAGNLKYLFLDFVKKNYECYFLTTFQEIYNLLKSKGLPVIKYDPKDLSLEDFNTIISSKYMFLDHDFDFTRVDKNLFFMLNDKVKFQLWHCIATKYTNENQIHIKDIKSNFNSLYSGRKSNDYILSLKCQEEITYKDNYFEPKVKFINSPPSKVDSLKEKHDEYELLNVDLDNYGLIKEKYKKKEFNIIYCPTYRPYDYTVDTIFNENKWFQQLDFKLLDDFCLKNNINFFMNTHQSDTVHFCKYVEDLKFKKIKIIKEYTDIYPLLYFTNALITDYSSIYSDYIKLKRPIIFFRPDKKKFENEVGIYKDNILSCGQEVIQIQSLLDLILEIKVSKNDYLKKFNSQINEALSFFSLDNPVSNSSIVLRNLQNIIDIKKKEEQHV